MVSSNFDMKALTKLRKKALTMLRKTALTSPDLSEIYQISGMKYIAEFYIIIFFYLYYIRKSSVLMPLCIAVGGDERADNLESLCL